MNTLKQLGIGILGLMSVGMMSSGLGSGNTVKAESTFMKPIAPGKLGMDKTSSKIKLALLLDTSNSMDGLIDQAKSQLWNIVNELSKAKSQGKIPDLEIALYQYGNDGLSSGKGFIQQEVPFTADLDMVSEKLFGLTTNGGSEFCGQVMHTSLSDLRWGDDHADYKAIFIAGNESFSQGDTKPERAFDLAKDKDVFVNTIFCGRQEQGIAAGWNAGLQSALGAFMNIDSDQKTVYIETPYDQEIANLNAKLNDTYVWYGDDGERAFTNMNTQDSNAEVFGKSNLVNRALTKNGDFYQNRNYSWDLVDKLAQEPGFNIKSIKSSQLPEFMQKMTPAEKTQYVMKKKREREEITEKIGTLGIHRAEHIATEKAKLGEDASLEKAMLTTVLGQARSKGFAFEDKSIETETATTFTPSLVDFDYFMETAGEVQTYRKDRLVDFNHFLSMSKESKTIILDTRSKEHFDAMHIRGAIHLNFSGFNVYDLAELIPDKNTRILIYCNNNIDTDNPAGFTGIRSKTFEKKIKRAMVSKARAPIAVTNEMVLERKDYSGAGLDQEKTLALNIPTFITLYGYGYKNIYELNELVKPNDSRLVLEGTAVPPVLGSTR